MEAAKTCKTCGKGDVEFSGRHKECKGCQSLRAVTWARNNREKKRAANNRYHQTISSKRSDRTRAYREQHPERWIAHQSVQTAIRNGSLIKDPCEVCGAIHTHAHHDDYEKPLEVRWLCHTHHMEHHAMLSQEADE